MSWTKRSMAYPIRGRTARRGRRPAYCPDAAILAGGLPAMATSTPPVPLTRRPAWSALQEHHRQIRDTHLRTLFAGDPSRGERLTLDAVGLYFDYSKNRITDETIRLLLQLAEESGLRERIDP